MQQRPGTDSRQLVGQLVSTLEPIADHVARATAFHQAGLLGQAEEIYNAILFHQPGNAEALHFLGLIAHQRGRSAAGVELMLRSVESEPGKADFFFNLGRVFDETGELEQAVFHYRASAALNPGLHRAHKSLGDTLLKLEKWSEAAASYARALSLEPDSPSIVNTLGSLLQRMGKIDQAVACYRKAILLKTDYAEAHNNLGTALKALGRLEEASHSYRRAIALKPELAGAHANLGGVFAERGDFSHAVQLLQRAIRLQPDLAEAHLSLGTAFRGQGLLNAAAAELELSISLAPHLAAAWNNLGLTYQEQDRLDDAVRAFQKALALQPDLAAAYSNLLCLYANTRHVSPEAEREVAEGWEKNMLSAAERAAARDRAAAFCAPSAARSRAGRRLRLGIVSADLGDHVAAEFLQPFLERLDRTRFHLTLFPSYRRLGARSEHLKSLADNFIPLTHLSDSCAAERVREENIDVLIDATGHTFGGRPGICAHRAAPVQCNYIGYWSTTGLTEMDWIIVDPFFLPSMEAHFTEGAWRLPVVSACYRGDTSLPESSWTPDPDGTIWLGSFNRYIKIRRQTLCLWASVLRALPQARLLLEDRAAYEDETHQRICGVLLEQGVTADRVLFVPPIADHRQHMELYNKLDIALDTVPFNSGTTGFDALWMGAPLVALEGDWTGGRIVSSILKAFDHRHWIAQNEQEYVAIVCALARDVEGRRHLRKTQRSRMALSSLCDADGIARALEDAFEAMYDARADREHARAKF